MWCTYPLEGKRYTDTLFALKEKVWALSLNAEEKNMKMKEFLAVHHLVYKMFLFFLKKENVPHIFLLKDFKLPVLFNKQSTHQIYSIDNDIQQIKEIKVKTFFLDK